MVFNTDFDAFIGRCLGDFGHTGCNALENVVQIGLFGGTGNRRSWVETDGVCIEQPGFVKAFDTAFNTGTVFDLIIDGKVAVEGV